jgi:hypothetical protein
LSWKVGGLVMFKGPDLVLLRDLEGKNLANMLTQEVQICLRDRIVALKVPLLAHVDQKSN